ncbi:TetR/AcrR family transcriptional regulator [Microlunatus capsulatus]|uniref:AcrR family transcriptional regulator n=1 Tax=Microlunatus capsulatus TaxID=99117 RepID=A0ABS4ZDE3_9ACTN|nr:TetR/AcrR family transcriptional regulator C-terminal domain-containing protein [Microlunatus capsulatus]MBP2419051.1 AcrR family transcriptional regulator [Microlunatus capsulatus]
MGQQDERESRSAGLSRALVVRAALELIDEDGLQNVSMRAVGQRLGVGAMALYRYVSGREDLLEAVVASLVSGLREDLDPQLTGTWQGYLQTLAHAVRRVAVEHAAAFPLIATRHPAAPWLRPPLRSVDLVEDFLTVLSGHGFTDQQVADAYRAFSSFLLGHLLLESAARGADTAPVEEPFDEGDAQIPHRDGLRDLADTPTTRRLRPLLSEDRSDEEFEVGLETLLDRLEMVLSQ